MPVVAWSRDASDAFAPDARSGYVRSIRVIPGQRHD